MSEPRIDKCANCGHMRGQHKSYTCLAANCEGKDGHKCKGFIENQPSFS